MFQPFELFKPQYITRLIALKKIYLVKQSYERGFDHFSDQEKTGILVTDYDDYGLAKVHLDAIKKDKYAAVMDLTKEKHGAKLKEMLAEGSPYRVYWAIVKDIEVIKKRIDLKYKDNIRRYIMQQTTWRISGSETIRPQLQVIFGELFIILKRSSQELRVKFEEIEKS